ncbi:MAG: hypothetical protein QUS07_07290 [Methanothrix sp.]|nr:hypothetical protein [Methanothrix sp.]
MNLVGSPTFERVIRPKLTSLTATFFLNCQEGTTIERLHSRKNFEFSIIDYDDIRFELSLSLGTDR